MHMRIRLPVAASNSGTCILTTTLLSSSSAFIASTFRFHACGRWWDYSSSSSSFLTAASCVTGTLPSLVSNISSSVCSVLHPWPLWSNKALNFLRGGSSPPTYTSAGRSRNNLLLAAVVPTCCLTRPGCAADRVLLNVRWDNRGDKKERKFQHTVRS